MALALNSQLSFATFAGTPAGVAEPIKINAVCDGELFGETWVMKRRSFWSIPLTSLANFYFRIAKIPIRFCCKPTHWQHWEVSCYQMLNGPRGYAAFAVGRRTVCAAKVPGESLFCHLQRGTLTLPMLTAAAKEFRRSHQMIHPDHDQPWSHGDATMSNVIFEEESGNARLIDFEIFHAPGQTAAQRHADDLLVFLLDLVGFVADEDWLPLSLGFLDAYGCDDVIAELTNQLLIPRGLARIWWHVRTNWVSTRKIRQRLETLNRALALSRQTKGPQAPAISRAADCAQSVDEPGSIGARTSP